MVTVQKLCTETTPGLLISPQTSQASETTKQGLPILADPGETTQALGRGMIKELKNRNSGHCLIIIFFKVH